VSKINEIELSGPQTIDNLTRSYKMAWKIVACGPRKGKLTGKISIKRGIHGRISITIPVGARRDLFGEEAERIPSKKFDIWCDKDAKRILLIKNENGSRVLKGKSGEVSVAEIGKIFPKVKLGYHSYKVETKVPGPALNGLVIQL
jgi:hypothetical protein